MVPIIQSGHSGMTPYLHAKTQGNVTISTTTKKTNAIIIPFQSHIIHTVETEFSVTNFLVYIFLSMLSDDFLLCQTFWSKYLWIFLAIYVDYSYFDAQVRCTYLVPNMTLTLMFNRNYNNLRYSIKKIKSLLEQKFFLLKSVCEFSLKH